MSLELLTTALQLLTLGVLAAVVIVKYLTWKHTQNLAEEKMGLEVVVDQTEFRYKQLRDKRQEGEKGFEELKRDRSGLETFLQKLQENLMAQNDKNRDLENLLA